MPDAHALTYKNLQDAVLGKRFPETQRTNAKRWLTTAYADVWNALRDGGDTWGFELVSRSSLSVTAGDSTPPMPGDYSDTTGLWDSSGYKLERLGVEDFEDYAALPAGTTTTPYVYAVIDRQIHLAPTPGTLTLTHSYRRRLCHVESDGSTVTAGMMTEDDDYPVWNADHHSVVIARARSIGLRELNDPTWTQEESAYQAELARMRVDLETRRPQRAWAASTWD